MTPFLSYLLKANLVLALLYGFYLLCFRRDTFYGHIRWYLLATIVSAIAFPLVNISDWLAGSPAVVEVSQYVPDMNAAYQYVLAQPEPEYTVEPVAAARTIPFALIIWWCWLPVTVFLSGKRLFQLACIARLWRRYPRQRSGSRTVIAVDRNIQPFSFAGRIFLNPSLYSGNELDEIIAHEQVHCRQGHTMDILLAEALVCLCWFNPAAWLLRRDLKQNLEYDTDRRTLQSGFDRKHYQYNLLRVSGSAFQIVNHFHFNHLKKRIIMMNKKESPRILTAKYLLVVPALAAALLTVQVSGLQARETDKHIEDHPVRVDVTILPAKDIPVDVTVGENRNPVTDVTKGVVNPDSSIHPLYPNGYPTVILDGEVTPYEDINKVDPKDVDKIIVFKDKAYDAPVKNENGVVLITTKRNSPYSPQKRLFMQNSPNDSIITDYRIRQGTTISKAHELELLLNDHGSEILLNAINIPEGSVVVTAAETRMVENVDYTVDYSMGRVKILNSELLKSGTPIKISVDNATLIQITKNEATGVTFVTTKRGSPVSGGNQPLYVVDGKEISNINLNNIPPDNIESIKILKDQTATSLYGEKAQNGVIIITTKK